MDFVDRKYGSVTAVVTANQGIELTVNGESVINEEVPEGKSWEIVISMQIIETDV